MKGNRSFKIIIFSILLIALTIGGYLIFNQPKNKVESTQNSAQSIKEQEAKPQKYNYTNTEYFMPITGLKNNIVNTTVEDLKKLDKIYVLEKDLEALKKISELKDLKFVSIVSDKEFVKLINADTKTFGLSSVGNLNFKVKSLAYNGDFLFDKTLNLEKYPLKITTKLESNTKQTDISNYSHEKLTKLGHTGAMIPGRGVVYHIEKKFKSDYKKLFESTKPLLDTFDFTSATFESPILGKGQYCDSCMVFVGPDKFMEGVKYSGIDLFTLAANHIMDGGVEALDNTMKQLEKANIKHVGASTRNNDEAGKPILIEVNGLKIAYLAFNDTPGYHEWATENTPGAASISDVEIVNGQVTKYEPNEERIKYFFQRAKDLKPDMIFVMMHWGGQEYVNEALPYQEKLAKLLVDNGADVILGDHPHWVQEMQIISDKPVFYSVGNYIFDQMWSIETMQGMFIELDYLDKKLVNFRLYPHQLDLYAKGMPVLLKPEQKEYNQTLNRVWEETEFDF